MAVITIPGLPAPLTCDTTPAATFDQPTPDSVTLHARARDDLFADPASDSLVMSASIFAFEAVGDFQFRARVGVEFVATYDSGVLVGYFGPRRWFKICAELDPAGIRRVVTVVTDGSSDDANSSEIVGDSIHLRLSRTGKAIALHFSRDGGRWSLARLFTVTDATSAIQVGIAAQSPTGEGTTATFSDFGWATAGLTSARDGS